MSKTNQQTTAPTSVAVDDLRLEAGELFDRVTDCFHRVEPFLKAKQYVFACASDLPTVNCWTISEFTGDSTPNKTQRLLARARWDEDRFLREVRRHVVEKLDGITKPRTMCVFAVDESGQEKGGESTAGVKRQYMGCAGRVANGINTVYLAYARENVGHALIGARQWIPEEHINNPTKANAMGLPKDLPFETKGQIAVRLLKDAHADAVTADFVTGDEVYGASPELRKHCEDNAQGYVLRVKNNHRVTLGDKTDMTCKQITMKLLKHKRDWSIRSAGTGSKGHRLYAWAWIATESPQHFLLIRRHMTTGECAYHYCHVPEGHTATLHRPMPLT